MLSITDNNILSLVTPTLMEDDLLKRDEFLNTAMTVANALAKQRKSACYAIDGAWGVGKTYVLNKLDRLFKEVTPGTNNADSQYLVFRYNCWEYDYYEEPLIAIVSAILDQIDAYEGKIKKELKDRIVHGIKEVGKTLFKFGLNVVATQLGILNSEKWKELISNFGDGFTADLNNQQFDQYISFKKQLKELQGHIQSLSERFTVVFLVDELDRCLPTYAIKVLERLHHLFEGVPNVQVILCIDKTQLKKTVQEIYGAKTDVDKYLAKFIQFSLNLGEGSAFEEEKFNNKFAEYKALFHPAGRADAENVSIFLKELFRGIEIRHRIAIVDKAQLIHQCIVQEINDKLDIDYMCMELWLSTICYCGLRSYQECPHFQKYNGPVLLEAKLLSSANSPLLSSPPEGMEGISENYISAELKVLYGNIVVQPNSFWAKFAFIDRTLFCKQSKIGLLNEGDPSYEKFVKEYWSMLQKIS